MSFTGFIIWNSLINNGSNSDPIEVSPAFEAFIGYLFLAFIGAALVLVVIMLGILLWAILAVAWDWVKDKYTAWKWKDK